MVYDKINYNSPDPLSNALREWYLITKNNQKEKTKNESNNIQKEKTKTNIYSSINHSNDSLSVSLREWWQLTKSHKNK